MSNSVVPNVFEMKELSAGRSSHIRDRLTCTVREACHETGIGKTRMHELISGGVLESVKIGRRRLVKVTSLLRLVQEDR
jgi:excisionase family DNA binding protein